MKPDWKFAPEWARYVAMDSCGNWYWYEEHPEMNSDAWYRKTDTKMDLVNIAEDTDWIKSLQERPR